MSRPTTIYNGNTLTWVMMLYDSSNVRVDADSTPTVTVRRNGSSTADVVTVTKRALTTGIYDCSVTFIASAVGDIFEIEETAVISSTTYDQVWALTVVSDEADVVAISGDAAAADNLELQYDGTGLFGENYPAYQSQLSDIAVTGSAVNATYDNWTNTTANVVAGTPDDTQARDGVYYQLEDVAGTLSVDIEFQVGSDGVPTGFSFYGYLTSGNDDVEIQAYNWITASYQKVGDVVGRNSASVREVTIPLFVTNVGTGADEGRVIIRLFSNALTSADLYIDQVYASYAVVNRSVGYALGAVWNDDGGSNAGTTPFIDGTADNRTNSYANAVTVANAVNLFVYEWTKDDAVTLTQDHDKDTFIGFKYFLNMNNQKAPTTTKGAIAFGTDASTETHFFSECALGDLQNGNGSLLIDSDIIATQCVVEDLELPAVAAVNGRNVQLSSCVGLETGTFAGDGYIDFGALAGTNHRLVASDWGGSIELRNMTAGDFATIAGTGTVTLAASCTGGTFIPAGVINVIDNSATVTIVREGLNTKSEIADAVWDEPASSHIQAGSTGLYLLDAGLVASKLDTALEDDGASGWQYTTLALENAPSGGGGLTVQQIVDGVWDEVSSAHNVAGSFGAYVDSTLSQMRTVVDDTANDVIQVQATIDGTPGVALTPAQQNAIIDGVLDEALADHTTAGSLGKAIADIEVDTNDLQSNQGSWLTADLTDVQNTVDDTNADLEAFISTTTTNFNNLDTKITTVDNVVDAILVDTDELQTKLIPMLILDGSVYQWTINALENAPSGGGGACGDGAYSVTIDCDDSSGAVQGVRMGIVGTSLENTTGTDGTAFLNLDDGSYVLRITPPSGYDAVADIPITIAGSDITEVITLTETTPPGSCEIPPL